MKIKSLIGFMLIASSAMSQQAEISLYKGTAPGSETWNWNEGVNSANSVKVKTVYNVVHPSLAVFLPESKTANGTAIIIAPGGGFHFLAIDHEGNNAANILAKKGVTVFVLKYRLVHVTSENPFDDMLNAKDPKAWDDEAMPVIPLAVADGRVAIQYVRSHAGQYKISPDKIGIMGFSAGGLVATASAFNYEESNKPDFVAGIYADTPDQTQVSVLRDAPPLFLICTQDDEYGFAQKAITLYQKWYDAHRPAELHLLTKGGHGFGIGDKKNTTYQWLDKFSEWMEVIGMMR